MNGIIKRDTKSTGERSNKTPKSKSESLESIFLSVISSVTFHQTSNIHQVSYKV